MNRNAETTLDSQQTETWRPSPVVLQRWFTLPERVMQHPAITAYRMEPKRFKTVHAGRRSYKTEIAKRTLVTEGMKHDGHRYFFGAPTRDQAKRVAWNDLKLLADPLITAKSETELWVRLATGSEIWVVGFDRPERFEGSLWHGGVLDEYGDMRAEVWRENVYPALIDTKGWCWLIGVPEGKNHYYELSLYAASNQSPEWGDYCWLSADVLDPVEIEGLRSQYDERTFRQEFEGSFESWEGRAYVYYDSTIHRRPQSFRPGHPLTVSCDFNLDPCVWIIGQDYAGFLSFQDEIVQRQTTVWRMCDELKSRISAMGANPGKQRITFYGDLEHGKQRTVAATATSWEIIREQFSGWHAEFRLRGHPRIVDRVSAVNAKLMTVDKKVHMGIDPKCQFLHKDFEMVSMEDLTGIKPEGDRTHASDAVGYQIWFEYPIGPRTRVSAE